MKRELELPNQLEPQAALIQQVIEIAERFYSENDAAHDFDHALRVTRLALRIGTKEEADVEVLALAGILHDIARREQELTGVCHAKKGAEMANTILTEIGYDEDKRHHVTAMIRTHRFRVELRPETLEAKILYDADKLDAIGAIGIGRAYAMGGFRGQRMYSTTDGERPDEDSREYSPVAEYRFKLRTIVDKMLTPSGRKMAKKRHEFMVQFFEELEEEVNGRV
jgi:uncharacterized protein